MRALVVSALVLSLAGCSSAAADAPGVVGAGGSSSGAGGSESRGPREVEITPPGDLAAREPVTITVRAVPPRVYQFQFALPSAEGDPMDAVLDRSEAQSDEDGYASVVLTPPSAPTTFQLRATVGTVSAVQPLTVADGGVATVAVQPRRLNLSVLRDITTWVASAHPNETCAALPGIPPDDGPIVGIPAGKADSSIIPRVPAGTRLAITLRSGHFIGGCTTVESLPPGPLSSPQVVFVTLLNRPIDLAASSLNLSLGLDGAATAWSAPLASSGESAKAALVGTSTDDVDALLDAMREASGDSRQAFENARRAKGWDDAVRGHFGAGAATAVRQALESWLVLGRARFTRSDPTFRGLVSPLPSSSGESTASLELSTVAGVSASDAGFAESARVAWSASPDDTVTLGAELYFVGSRLALSLAEAAALDAHPDAGDAAEALAAELDCQAIGEDLTAVETFAYGECDADCVRGLCEQAAGALWERGADAEGLSPSRLSITATAKAYVGDQAELAGLTGRWIGELGASKVSTGGALTGAAPPTTK